MENALVSDRNPSKIPWMVAAGSKKMSREAR
jgi:hypothetical protein